MRYLELFTGIAGFSKGIEQAYEKTYRQSNCNASITDASVNLRVGNGASARHGTEDAGSDGKAECVGFSEIGKVASGILKYRYPDIINYGDATAIVCDELLDFDFLVGGFPCQAFSIAGKRKGFEDTRGTLFFEIARILAAKRPGHFLLENVPGLLSHDNGQTFRTIIAALDEIGYDLEWTIINSKHHGVPQNRERVFIVGHPRNRSCGEILSFGATGQLGFENGEQRIGVLSGAIDSNYHKEPDEKRTMIQTGTLRTYKDGEGFRPMANEVSPSLNARARQDGSQQPIIAISVQVPEKKKQRGNGRRMKRDGEARFTVTAQDRHGVMIAINDKRAGSRVYDSEGIAATVTANITGGTKNERCKVKNLMRRLTPTECARLQGFPDDWTDFGVFEDKNGDWHVRKISDTGKYQVFGNAITVNVVEAIITQMRLQGCLDG